LIDDKINYIANSLQLKGNFLTSQGIALGVEYPTKGGKLQPSLKVVLTTLSFTLKSGLD